MKRALFVMIGVLCLTGVAGAATIDTATFTADVENGIEVTGDDLRTLEIDQEIETIEGDITLDNLTTNVTVIGDTDVFSSVGPASQIGNGTAETTYDTNGSLNLSAGIADGFDDETDVTDALTIEADGETVRSYDVVGTTGGDGTATIGEVEVQVPAFLQDVLGDRGAAFVFYGLTVGAVILAGMALYFLWKRQTMSRAEETIGYAGVSLGSIGSVLSENALVIFVVFAGLLVLVAWLWRTRTETRSTTGTVYIE